MGDIAGRALCGRGRRVMTVVTISADTPRRLARTGAFTVESNTEGEIPSGPVLSPDVLRAIAHDVLQWSAADTMSVSIHHTAIGMARVAMGRVRMQDNGDRIFVSLVTQFGQRAQVTLGVNQIDTVRLRQAVTYLDRAARELPGDPTPIAMPIPARTYFANTTWRESTASAFAEARHSAVATLIAPILDAGLTASAFVGVYAHARLYADKRGIVAAGEETDSEIVATGWSSDGKGAGWAGQAARDWTALDVASVAARTIELTQRAANPVAFEPGRRTVILDRPAVAQIVHAMGNAFSAQQTLSGWTPLYNPSTRRPRLGERVMDARIMMRSDPNDPDGGFLPFDNDGFPRIPMTWIDHGVHANLAFDASFAAERGYTPANDPPRSLRLESAEAAGRLTVEEMIADCTEGVYVNRFAYVGGAGSDSTVGLLRGVTTGGCFLVRKGAIDKPLRNFWFLDSPWAFLNRIEAIGTSARAPFGYAPWAGNWPIDPTIVPPLMIRDFNFNMLADSV